ncbi:UDP-glucuronate:xylan alpha-glucuronosyltransferase 2 isoform X1 [Punica granatum]|uniref:Hexosyltransferase n=2 Tax=Punica granatum TaxID=22663 RepID=A0A6P8ELG7_PUNGR|nr:UDP-glucuronate:xylan alpha-glucuronosyltransferase 2 isoform X1 [Punica granatum]
MGGEGQITQQAAGNNNVMKMVKSPSSKALVVRINLVFLACFLVVYATLILRPSSSVSYHENSAALVRCSLRECHHKVDGVKMKAVLEDKHVDRLSRPHGNGTKIEAPDILKEMLMGSRGTTALGGKKKKRIGMINMDEDDVSEWGLFGDTVQVQFDRVSELFEWKDLFPEWIDEEEESDVPLCPEIPMPEFKDGEGEFDLVVVKVPCKYPEEGWNRDVARLQMHLVAANVAVRKAGKRRKPRVAVLSQCRPMMEIFRCDDLVKRKGDWWVYEPDMVRLGQKVSLPVGSCKLALPLWGQGINEIYDLSRIHRSTKTVRREAYATVLHSSEAYVCGAITLAQSLIKTGTKRDLVLLIDKSISEAKREALALAGWKIRMIKRIRNPKSEKNTYNEYNYSKFRLWQLTDYDKVIFIDADIIVLRNLDLLFYFPQMSAIGNDNWIFNSGIMVIEPSNCTFKTLMDLRNDIISYNGGDQGFLNEVFVWWHRLPRRVNFLKNFWSNTTAEASMKNQLFGADPPKLYSIHFLGWKPWLCYRDYDCNWDVPDQRVYASDVAHHRWWKFHDGMDQRLHKFCALTKRRRTDLNWERRRSRLMKSSDHHWKINITDPRRLGSNLV